VARLEGSRTARKVWAHDCEAVTLARSLMLPRSFGHVPALDRRKYSDGSVVRYVQLAHNHRKDGVGPTSPCQALGDRDA
jgi:hypothetical protein